MKNIAFTQYLRPDGRKETIYIEMEDDVAEKAERIVAAGFRLEAEVLTNGLVSVTIAGKNCDVDIYLVPNGPEVPAAIEAMINTFDFDRSREMDDNAGLE